MWFRRFPFDRADWQTCHQFEEHEPSEPNKRKIKNSYWLPIDCKFEKNQIKFS